MTPIFPQSKFLLAATAANVGKSVGITCSISTQPSFFKSFAKNENLADIAAKQHAQTVVADTLGLAIAIALTGACGANAAMRRLLPFVAFPPLAAIDIFAIHREMKAVELKTLNRERAELAARCFVESARVPSPRQMTGLDTVFGDSFARGAAGGRAGRMRLRIVPLNRMNFDECEGDEVAGAFGVAGGDGEAEDGGPAGAAYLLQYQGAADASSGLARALAHPALARARAMSAGPGARDGWIALAMADGATEVDILQGILHAEYFRRMCESDECLRRGPGAAARRRRRELVRASRTEARASRDAFVDSLRGQGYQIRPFLLSAGERSRWRVRVCARGGGER